MTNRIRLDHLPFGEVGFLAIVLGAWIRTGVNVMSDDPITAIDGGPDGLALARASLDVARRHLAPAGVMLLQLGSLDEADGVRRLAGPELEVCEIRQPDPAGVVVSVRRTAG
jgi:release factor glutamine methyltransferase